MQAQVMRRVGKAAQITALSAPAEFGNAACPRRRASMPESVAAARMNGIGLSDVLRGAPLPTLLSLVFGLALVLVFAVPANAYLAYVSNEKGNTVSVIDTEKMQVVKTIKVGQRPRGIGITKDGKYILVCVGD